MLDDTIYLVIFININHLRAILANYIMIKTYIVFDLAVFLHTRFIVFIPLVAAVDYLDLIFPLPKRYSSI